ncbi:hypothetical protein D3Z36_16450 [Lachnospiraceae bacterium]|nr:hypothetical protein [Lachnospiraceae bacterium]
MSRIYAGRTEIPKINKHIYTYEELAARAQEQKQEQKVQKFTRDKITFSQEGMKSAREMRKYLNENGLSSSIDFQANLEELDKQLHTKTMDYTNNFWQEMGEVIEQQRTVWGSQAGETSFDNSVASWAKAYQVVHDRIVDEFSRTDREVTYVIDEATGERREETVDDRLAELDYAYEARTTFIAASKKVMVQIQEVFGGKKSPAPPEAVEQKIRDAYKQAVSEENLERLRRKVDSFEEYRPDLSIGSFWEQILGEIW